MSDSEIDHETVEKSELVVGNQSASLEPRPGQQVAGLSASGHRHSEENAAPSLTREGEGTISNEAVASVLSPNYKPFPDSTAPRLYDAHPDSPTPLTFNRQVSRSLEDLSKDELVEECKALRKEKKEFEEIISRWGLMVDESADGVQKAIRIIDEHASQMSLSNSRPRAKSCGIISGPSEEESAGEKGVSVVVASDKLYRGNRAVSTPNVGFEECQERETPFTILQEQSSRFSPHKLCVLCRNRNQSTMSKTHPYTKSILNIFTTKFYDANPPATEESNYSCRSIDKCTWCLLCRECNQCTSKIESDFAKRLGEIHKDKKGTLTLQSLDDQNALVLRIWTYLALAVNVNLYRAELDLPANYFKQLEEFMNQASDQHKLVTSSYVPNRCKEDLLFHFEKDEQNLGRFPCLYIVDLPNCRVMIIYGQLPPLGLHWAFTLERSMTATLQDHFPKIVNKIKELHTETYDPKPAKNCKLVVRQLRCWRKYCFVVTVGEHVEGVKLHDYPKSDLCTNATVT